MTGSRLESIPPASLPATLEPQEIRGDARFAERGLRGGLHVCGIRFRGQKVSNKTDSMPDNSAASLADWSQRYDLPGVRTKFLYAG